MKELMGLSKSKSQRLIFIFLVITYIIGVSDAQPKLVSSDNVNWTQTSDSNEKYKNWTIFERDVKRFEMVYVIISNITQKNSDFEWKTDKVDDYIDVNFIVNGNIHDICKSVNFIPIKNFRVNPNDELELKFWVRTSKDIRVSIAFPPTIEIVPPNTPPDVPEILSGPSEGYNKSSYGYSVKSSDKDGDQIAYNFNWGDGNSSQTELINSDEIVIRNHSWNRAGVYNVTVMATDEHGANSSFSKGRTIKISWLVKVPPGVLLQPVIDRIYSNTMVLLEGDDYIGPINITKSNITISSNSTRSYSNIRSGIDDSKNYTIGLINSSNVTIEELYISEGFHEIIITNCTYCKILNNNMSIKKCGVHIYNSNNTTIEGNLINKGAWSNSLGGSVGISVDYSDSNTIRCNTIQGLDNEKDSIYYIINSSLKEFKVDSTIDGLIFKNGCCGNYTNGRLVNSSWCSFENGVVTFSKHSNNETNCSIELDIGGC